MSSEALDSKVKVAEEPAGSVHVLPDPAEPANDSIASAAHDLPDPAEQANTSNASAGPSRKRSSPLSTLSLSDDSSTAEVIARPAPKRPREWRHPSHPIFHDSRNDIVLRSDDFEFCYQRQTLLEASEVFRVMLADGAEGSGKRTERGHPIIDLDDSPTALTDYLICIHPLMVDSPFSDWRQIEAVCAIADKYNSRALLLRLIPKAADLTSPRNIGPTVVLGLAIVFDQPRLIAPALRTFLGDFTIKHDGAHKCRYTLPGMLLHYMPLALSKRCCSTVFFHQLQRLQTRLLDPAVRELTSWTFVADKILRPEPETMQDASELVRKWNDSNG